MRPGRFNRDALKSLSDVLSAPDIIVVGHNAFQYDLPVLSGLLVAHGLAPLPDLLCQDTMNDLKTGQAYRNSLKAQCRRYNINLKDGSPDWDRVLQGYPDEWEYMRLYNMNDVVSTLQLERALNHAGIPAPIRVWRAHK